VRGEGDEDGEGAMVSSTKGDGGVGMLGVL